MTNAGRAAPSASAADKHWDRLRLDYINATPRQRLGPIVDRLEDPHHGGPNLLITAISAVEAFARSLVVEHEARSSARSKSSVYEKYKDDNAVDLVVRYLTLRRLGAPSKVFGGERWRSFCHAVKKYRHVLLHECTYLGWQKLEELNCATRAVLEQLVELSGHKARLERLVAEAKKTFGTAA